MWQVRYAWSHLLIITVQDDAEKKGMHWNPVFCRWEGNESALKTFESNHHRPNSGTTQTTVIHGPPSPPRAPALITNPGNSATQGVQVVGGMVFDPTRMCWLKLGRRESQQYPLSPTSLDEDDDPFKDIEDLKDKDDASAIMSVEGGRKSGVRASGGGTATAGASPGDWPVGEEFDLGPGFIHRQREAEKEWRERVGAWFSEGDDHDPGPVEVNDPDGVWQWSVRDVADGFVPEGMSPVEF